MNKPRYLIGIDPGTHTGIAVWDRTEKKLTMCKSVQTWELFEILNEDFVKWNADNYGFEVRIENPKTWKPFGKVDKADTSRLQGAGSIKRSYAVIVEYLEAKNIKYTPVSLQSASKKMDAATFKKLGVWEGKTNEHSRDAACLIING